MRISILVALASLALTMHGQTRRPQTSELIAILRQADASLHDRARACQQLGEFGGKEAVPALAALLADQHLSAYARSGLEGIPDPTAAAALRTALASLKGNSLIGVINSLGVLRDSHAVGPLSKLANDPSSGAAKESLLALGRISTPDAIKALQHSLRNGPESLRPDAAAGLLIAAEFDLSAGRGESSVALYDAVRKAAVPAPYQIAATRGAILARKSDGIPFLVSLLKSDERETRNIAMHTIREMKSSQLSKSLLAELDTSKPEVQAQLIEALAEFPDTQSVGAIRAKATNANPEVRRAALKVLWKIGDQSDVPVLLKAVQNTNDPTESAVAVESLTRMPGAEVDTQILRALASSKAAASRVALIDLLDARPPTSSATPELLRQAGDGDLKVSLAALKGLRSLVGVNELPALISLTKSYKDGSQRAAAESALYYASIRNGETAKAGELLLSELSQATEDLDEASWIKTLCSIGYAKALPAVSARMRDQNPWLSGITIDNLGKWPNSLPIDTLLGFAESGAEAGRRTRTLGAAVELAAATARQQTSTAEVNKWLQRAGKAAQSVEDKRVIISALGRWRDPASLQLLLPYLEDREVRPLAASAILDVAQPLALRPEHHSSIRPVVDKLAELAEPDQKERVDSLRRTVSTTAPKEGTSAKD